MYKKMLLSIRKILRGKKRRKILNANVINTVDNAEYCFFLALFMLNIKTKMNQVAVHRGILKTVVGNFCR